MLIILTCSSCSKWLLYKFYNAVHMYHSILHQFLQFFIRVACGNSLKFISILCIKHI